MHLIFYCKQLLRVFFSDFASDGSERCSYVRADRHSQLPPPPLNFIILRKCNPIRNPATLS